VASGAVRDPGDDAAHSAGGIAISRGTGLLTLPGTPYSQPANTACRAYEQAAVFAPAMLGHCRGPALVGGLRLRRYDHLADVRLLLEVGDGAVLDRHRRRLVERVRLCDHSRRSCLGVDLTKGEPKRTPVRTRQVLAHEARPDEASDQDRCEIADDLRLTRRLRNGRHLWQQRETEQRGSAGGASSHLRIFGRPKAVVQRRRVRGSASLRQIAAETRLGFGERRPTKHHRTASGCECCRLRRQAGGGACACSQPVISLKPGQCPWHATPISTGCGEPATIAGGRGASGRQGRAYRS
jgi:hypothetical protein